MPAASFPVELPHLDLAPFAGSGQGPSHVLTLQGPAPGPTVAVNALMHGNEPCGAHAIAFLLEKGVRPRRGRLTLSFANVAAHAAFDVANPTASRFLEEDMNRVWSPEVLAGGRDTVEMRRARALLPVFMQADMLLDLHSLQVDAPALTLCGPTVRGAALAAAVGLPRWIVADQGHAGGRRLIDHPRFADPDGRAAAILVECGQHWRRATADVAIQTTLRFLAATGTVDADDVAPWLTPTPPEPLRRVEVTTAVTAATDAFRFVSAFTGMETIPEAGTVIAYDGEEPVRTTYADCVLIMPSRNAKRGQTAVRLGRLLSA